MKKFEDIWKKANEEADSKYEPRGTLAWGVFLKEALEKRIETLLEKQQPEIPEVPQFVADWYEENKGSLDYMIFETCRNLTDESTDEFENWFGYDENKAITTLVNMKNGYTVETPKAIVTPCPVCGYEEVESNFCSICGRKNDYE